jgi:hypothetical protein
MKSILQKTKRCLVCHTEQNLHLHHVYEGTGRRKISDKYGLTVWLCAKHHNMSDEGVHFNRELDLALKQAAQKKAMAHYGWDVEAFIKIFGKNYIE